MVFVLALALVAWAIVTIIRAGLNVPTNLPTTTIVESGPYRFTRNPIYLGMLLGLIGLAIAFEREFKLEAVRLVKERGVAVAQASRDLDLHENVLRKWMRDLSADPQHAFPGHGQMKPEQLEIEKLRREVAKLKAERDILKKAALGTSFDFPKIHLQKPLKARCRLLLGLRQQ